LILIVFGTLFLLIQVDFDIIQILIIGIF
jgi:hypothetical protein